MSDFVNVRLSAAGLQFAGNAAIVRVATARMDYRFSKSTTQRVLTSEWTKYLSQQMYQGKAIFEVADATTATATTSTATAAPAASSSTPTTTATQSTQTAAAAATSTTTQTGAK